MVYVVKLDQDGESEWGKTYTNPGNDRANCIQETADGNYVITGFTTVTVTANSLNSSNVDVLFLKIDEDGDILSQKDLAARVKIKVNGSNKQMTADTSLQVLQIRSALAGMMCI